MKKQIVVIHGGSTYANYKQYFEALKKKKLNFENVKGKKWKDCLGEKLGKKFEIIFPSMPNASNAKYVEWKIWFEKLIPFLEKEVVLVGHSLGGIFLAKYLSENKFPKKILGTFLIAPSYAEVPLSGFALKKDLSKLSKQSQKLFIYHSQDDKLVPTADFEQYKKVLPDAICQEFKNRGHFNQKTFPELVKEIKKLYE